MFKWNTLSLCAGVNFNVVFLGQIKQITIYNYELLLI